MNVNQQSQSRCVIVDNDPISVFLLSNYIHETPKLQLYEQYLDAQAAAENLTYEDNVDFLFIDISSENVSALDMLDSLRDRVRFVVFIGVIGSHLTAVRKLGIDNFLFKPISAESFFKTVNGLLRRSIIQQMRHSSRTNSLT